MIDLLLAVESLDDLAAVMHFYPAGMAVLLLGAVLTLVTVTVLGSAAVWKLWRPRPASVLPGEVSQEIPRFTPGVAR